MFPRPAFFRRCCLSSLFFFLKLRTANMRAHALQYLALATAALLYGRRAAAEDDRAVFAHYMVCHSPTLSTPAVANNSCRSEE